MSDIQLCDTTFVQIITYSLVRLYIRLRWYIVSCYIWKRFVFVFRYLCIINRRTYCNISKKNASRQIWVVAINPLKNWAVSTYILYLILYCVLILGTTYYWERCSRNPTWFNSCWKWSTYFSTIICCKKTTNIL